MPKKISRPRKKSSDEEDRVLVKSATYGHHKRRPRGSVKPAKLNTVVAAHANRQAVLTRAASCFYAVLNIYSKGFREGQLWQEINNLFWLSKTDKFEDFLAQTQGMDLNRKYRLRRFGTMPGLETNVTKERLHFKVNAHATPLFENEDNDWYYELAVLMFMNEKEEGIYTTLRTPWLRGHAEPKVFDLAVERPEMYPYYAIVLKLQAGKDGKENTNLAGRAMYVVKAGKVS